MAPPRATLAMKVYGAATHMAPPRAPLAMKVYGAATHKAPPRAPLELVTILISPFEKKSLEVLHKELCI